MISITVPDLNDSVGRITLSDREYYIRFTYNSTKDYWSVGLYDIDMVPIIPMTKIVPNFPIFFYYTYVELPDGIMGCLTNKTRIGRKDFINGEAEMVYIPRDEVPQEVKDELGPAI